MSLAKTIPHDTRVRQHNASDPSRSVWVSANAGSGKTHVLVQRVLRLLLEGVLPAKILCLTFTKAAAANMSVRVFETLAAWTRLSDSELHTAIVETGERDPKPATLILARRLFARTVETPGGLKIQTIHAFCERLLHLFPFEANVPARFEVLEDLRQVALLEQARLDVLTRATQDCGRLGDALAGLADEVSDIGFDDVIRQALNHAPSFRKVSEEEQCERLRRALHLNPNDTIESIRWEIVEGGLSLARWDEIAAILSEGKKTDIDKAVCLQSIARARRAHEIETAAASCLELFFTEKGCGTPVKTLATKAISNAHPSVQTDLENEQQRLERLRDKMRAVTTLKRSRDLLAIAREIFTHYEEMKAQRGLLDFGDLIEKTLTLLDRSDARWVLYKLDRGIDHILVDEAQDTSEAQWKILEDLMSDFAVGANAASNTRTFFAVGDDKQSIFSFQGAAPHMFHDMSRKLKKKLVEGGESFSHVKLNMSFRSVPAILKTVDKIFERDAHKKGVIVDNEAMFHEALKRDLPGLVELWPLVAAVEAEEPSDWALPVDALDEQDPASIMASRIAAKISELLTSPATEHVFDSRTRLPRPVQAEDILILVRTRGPFFEAVIRALKQANVPVAGADRLELTAHIAMMDLVAIGRAALLPQDDLTLACVLKSPLIGLDDDDLIALAPQRKGSLIEALAQSPEPRHQQACEKIALWIERARRELPFAFYMRLLSEDGGRRDMEARLGPEARDAIDEFLRLALLHEKEPAPSLAGFLAGLEDVDLAIKRDMERGTGAVRVMTVHAAKGLEAKIVFLPDTCGLPAAQHDPKLFLLGDSKDAALAWSPRKAEDCSQVALAREKARERADEEYRRLLYVALTRAEERLYIAGFHGKIAPQPSCWYKMIEVTLEEAFESVPAFWNPEESLLRYAAPGASQFGMAFPTVAAEPPKLLAPGWLHSPVTPEASPRPPLRPSSVLAAADTIETPLVAPAQREAMRRGRLMHVLLQHLPGVSPERRAAVGESFLQARAGTFSAPERSSLIEDALAILDAPELAALFAPGSRAEVPIAGRVVRAGDEIPISGQVDRIAETESEVLIADFKTGQPQEGPDIPRAYLIQMALYRAALAPLWPTKELKMLLIWTVGPKIVTLSDALLDQTLATL